MNKDTLNERYVQKKQLMLENLILEKFDKKMASEATKIIKSLNAIDFNSVGLTVLAAARDEAIKDANRALGGKSNQGILRRIVALYKRSGKNNPLVDSLAFTNAISNFFETFIEYLDSYKGAAKNQGNNPEKMSVQELVIGTQEDQDEGTKLLQQVIKKGLRPDGILAQVGKTWQKKYFKNNWSDLANEIMQSNVSDIERVGQQAIESLKNSQAVGQAAAGAQEVANQHTSSTFGSEKPETTQKPSGTIPAERSKEASATGETSNVNVGEENTKVDDIFKRLEQANIAKQLDIPGGQLQALLQVLDRMGYIR